MIGQKNCQLLIFKITHFRHNDESSSFFFPILPFTTFLQKIDDENGDDPPIRDGKSSS